MLTMPARKVSQSWRKGCRQEGLPRHGAYPVAAEGAVRFFNGLQGFWRVGYPVAQKVRDHGPVSRSPEGVPLPRNNVGVLPVHHQVEKGEEGTVMPVCTKRKSLPEGRDTVTDDRGETRFSFTPDPREAMFQVDPFAA